MSDWPPVYEDTFIIHETGVPPHHRTLLAELRERFPRFDALTNREQVDLRGALYLIDMTASLAARNLGKSPWNAEELFSTEPPARAKSKKQRDQWQSHREHQYCINLSERARVALFRGEWGKAIHDALYAGYHLNGAAASSALGSAQGRLRAKQAIAVRTNHSQQRRETIIREAAEVKARHGRWSMTNVAREIEKKHSGEKGFPRWEAIRKILREPR